MFDFLKDMSLASHGVDVDAINAMKAENREEKRLGKFIFSTRAKIIVCVFAALYIAVTVYALRNCNGFSFSLVLDVLFIAVALAIIVYLWAFGKKGEVISLCGIIGMLVGIYIRAASGTF